MWYDCKFPLLKSNNYVAVIRYTSITMRPPDTLEFPFRETTGIKPGINLVRDGKLTPDADDTLSAQDCDYLYNVNHLQYSEVYISGVKTELEF